MKPTAIVKIGGSLYDLPDLGPRLDRWLRQHAGERPLVVPGGGSVVDAVRGFHRTHGISQEHCHWLALRLLSVNAHFLACLFGGIVVGDVSACAGPWESRRTPVLDMLPFALADERRPGCLAHDWTVTSDALAARVAAVAGVGRLVLLKSVTIPVGMSWEEAGRRGYVDCAFAEVVGKAGGLEVRVVNFRDDPTR
jgi:aspartokinase-like uncharacterized kinase